MLEAAFWGLVGGFALLVGAVVGLVWRIPRRVIGLVMAFGAGVLISALAFELTAEAYKAGGLDSTAAGLALGLARLLRRRPGARPHGRRGPQALQRARAPAAAAPGIVLGAVLDGIPESAAIGVSLIEGGGVSVAVVVAVFLSNVPESLSAATGLRATWSPARILALWSAVAVVSALAAALGYALLGDASRGVGGRHPGVRRRARS